MSRPGSAEHLHERVPFFGVVLSVARDRSKRAWPSACGRAPGPGRHGAFHREGPQRPGGAHRHRGTVAVSDAAPMLLSPTIAMEWRRHLAGQLIDRVVAHPAVAGRNYFDPDKIEVRWR